MADKAGEARERAEARFKKKEDAAREAAKGRALYEAEAKAVDENTVRLRALRLAREAEEAKAAEATPKKRAASRKRKAAV